MFLRRLLLPVCFIVLLSNSSRGIAEADSTGRTILAEMRTTPDSSATNTIWRKKLTPKERLLLERRFLQVEKAKLLRARPVDSGVLEYIRIINRQLRKIEERLNTQPRHILHRDLAGSVH